ATAFGALTIVNRVEEYGVTVKEVVNCGGIAQKNPLLMQIYADVFNRPMLVSDSLQTCALGAAIFGAAAGGLHPDMERAMQKMSAPASKVYYPQNDAAAVYKDMYDIYKTIHDAFGSQNGVLSNIMKKLADLRTNCK
ncbi:MAG: FGGY-family carbohydrate kinase, partial [Planctomycetia bacterium]|nr:FGGY-family carbohydrate kinase [Planctomycetia bacterium]